MQEGLGRTQQDSRDNIFPNQDVDNEQKYLDQVRVGDWPFVHGLEVRF